MPDRGTPTVDRQPEYRIRWANVRVVNGRYDTTQRLCIAERKSRWFGWWPCIDADWSVSENQADRDIQRDKRLRMPPPQPRIVE